MSPGRPASGDETGSESGPDAPRSSGEAAGRGHPEQGGAPENGERSTLSARPLPATWADVLSLSLLGGCGDAPGTRRVREEAGDAWQAAKAWGPAKRAEADRVYVTSVDRLAKRYEDAVARARAMGGDAAQALEARWADVTRRLAEVTSAGADDWERTRDAFVAAYEAFQREMAAR